MEISQTMNSLDQSPHSSETGPVFIVTFDTAKSSAPLDGRLLLLLSTDPADEPRFQIDGGLKSQIVFGLDVENWKTGEARVLSAGDPALCGSPIHGLRDLETGRVHRPGGAGPLAGTFHLADGRVLKLPTDRGEGRKWNRAPGNLYSKPKKILLDAVGADRIALALTEEIPPIPPPPDTKYVKHIKIQSERLSRFWGRLTYLGATFFCRRVSEFPLRCSLSAHGLPRPFSP